MEQGDAQALFIYRIIYICVIDRFLNLSACLSVVLSSLPVCFCTLSLPLSLSTFLSYRRAIITLGRQNTIVSLLIDNDKKKIRIRGCVFFCVPGHVRIPSFCVL